jgi:hypothetical protein
MANTNITIELHYTEINRKPDMRRNRFPLSGNTLMLSDWYREHGYTAHRDGNLLVISRADINLWEYVVSYDIDGIQHYMERSDADNMRFWQTVDRIVDMRLNQLVKHINHKTW